MSETLIQAIGGLARADATLATILGRTVDDERWFDQLAGDQTPPYVVVQFGGETPKDWAFEGTYSRTVTILFLIFALDSDTAETAADRIDELFGWQGQPPPLTWTRGGKTERVWDVDAAETDSVDRPTDLGPNADRYLIRTVGLTFSIENIL
jgi:hypothetical protein